MTWLAFDMDGTLYDCAEIVAPAFQRGIEKFIAESTLEIRTPEKSEIVALLGMPTSEIFTTLFENLTVEEYQRVNDLCLFSLVEDVKAKRGILYPGVREIISKLHANGYRLVIASNGRATYLKAILEIYGLRAYFEDNIIVLNDKLVSKDHIVAEYKKELGSGDLMIMIGDRSSDLQAAVVNGLPFVGCAFGHAEHSEIDGQKWLISDIVELPDVVKEIEDQTGVKRVTCN
jgi:adenosylhomocysteine nucleosidase